MEVPELAQCSTKTKGVKFKNLKIRKKKAILGNVMYF